MKPVTAEEIKAYREATGTGLIEAKRTLTLARLHQASEQASSIYDLKEVISELIKLIRAGGI